MTNNNSQQPNSTLKMYFYGSLRLDQYNYKWFTQRFGKENYQYQGTKTINGFNLYSLGSYPAIVPTIGGSIVVDEFLVSPEVFEAVRRMELGAGYHETQIDGAYIYHFLDTKWVGEHVTHGDWVKYLSKDVYEEDAIIY